MTAAAVLQPERASEPSLLTVKAGDAIFGPVRAGNAFEETVERLLTAVKLGIAAPGSQLPPERELSDRLNVSRVTLREAIRALQQSGHLESRRGRYGGTFVKATLPALVAPAPTRVAPTRVAPTRVAPTRVAPTQVATALGRDLDDTLVLREVLEVGAADQAAARRPLAAQADADAAHLTACQQDCGRAADVAEYRRLDSRFHVALAEVTGSSSLTAAVAGVRMRANALLDTIPVLWRSVEHSEVQHAEIVSAILAGDRMAARTAMAEHLSATAALLRGFLG